MSEAVRVILYSNDVVYAAGIVALALVLAALVLVIGGRRGR